MPIEVVTGNIVEEETDAIVNAANEALMPGGGVCGAIHRAAGPQLEAACRAIGRCPTGSAVITPGFRLRARYVIHAVGPRWRGGDHEEAELLQRCYESIFAIVRDRGLRSVAIPAISAGIYGYPPEPATAIAVRVAMRHGDECTIRFICFTHEVEKVYREMLDRELPGWQ